MLFRNKKLWGKQAKLYDSDELFPLVTPQGANISGLNIGSVANRPRGIEPLCPAFPGQFFLDAADEDCSRQASASFRKIRNCHDMEIMPSRQNF